MQLLCYAVKGNPSATRLDRSIAFFSRGDCSHSELRFSSGECFSSSPRDGACRFKNITLKPGHWRVYDLPGITPEEERSMKLAAAMLVASGTRYDYRGLFSFLLPWTSGDEGRFYCSEVCAHLLNSVGSSGWFGVRIAHASPWALEKLARDRTIFRAI